MTKEEVPTDTNCEDRTPSSLHGTGKGTMRGRTHSLLINARVSGILTEGAVE